MHTLLSHRRKWTVGTEAYAPPEVRGASVGDHYDPAAYDSWSLGMCTPGGTRCAALIVNGMPHRYSIVYFFLQIGNRDIHDHGNTLQNPVF